MSATDIKDTLRSDDMPRPNGDDLARAAEAAPGKVRRALQDGAHKSAEAARRQTAAVSRRVSEMTHDRPLTSVSTALGIGLAVGLLSGFCLARATEH